MKVYVIFNPSNVLYVGLTKNLSERLRLHNAKRVTTTKKFGGPWLVLHSWDVFSYIHTSKLERYLHSLEDVEILDVIAKYPSFCQELQDIIIKLKTTKFELKRCLNDLRGAK